MREIPTQNDDPGSTLSAVPFNSLANENENQVISSGQSLDAADDFQLSRSLANYVSVSDSYIDSGSANSYILSPNAPFLAPDGYRNGMRVRFIVGSTNTGASTINVATLGLQPFKKDGGINELVAGDLVAGREVWATFSTSAGGFFDLVAFLQNNLVQLPANVIVSWFRLTPSTPIPAGFALCDGTLGTPDLRGRFIVGEGNGFGFGQIGGQTSITTSVDGNHVHVIDNAGGHTHTITVDGHMLTIAEMPSHTHQVESFTTTGGTQIAGDGLAANNFAPTGSTGGGIAHPHTASSNSTGIHTHPISTTGDHTHQVTTLPPFFGLVYLMKT